MSRTRLLENELRVLRDESNRLNHERGGLAERIKENHEKIKLNNQLPYLVGCSRGCCVAGLLGGLWLGLGH